VSELCKRFDPVVNAWNNRSLRDSRYPFVIVDALVLKVREEGRVRARGVMLAYGVNTDVHREILGSILNASEGYLRRRSACGFLIVSFASFFVFFRIDSLYYQSLLHYQSLLRFTIFGARSIFVLYAT
jgi:hypothetical protein